jgi:hypothetical protein
MSARKLGSFAFASQASSTALLPEVELESDAILGMELSKSARTMQGLLTATPGDRQVIADAVEADARYLVTTDVDDFAIEDLTALALTSQRIGKSRTASRVGLSDAIAPRSSSSAI